MDTVDRILVTFCDGNTVDGHFVKQDAATGLAVIQIARNDLGKETRDAIAVGELGSASSVNQGDLVLALGSPSGYPDSVVCGRVTSTTNVKSTVDSEYHLLTTDIMGNSEGSGSGQSGRKDRGCDRAVFFRGGGYRGGDGIINLGSSETD